MIVANWVSDSKDIGEELVRLRARVAELEAKQLKPGEYVCRDVRCERCEDDPGYAECDNGIIKICPRCKGTGLVPERVG